MDLVLVDTCVLSFLEKNDTRAALYRKHLEERQIAVCFMTVAELFRWAIQRHWGQPRIASLVSRLRRHVILAYDEQMAWEWARLRAMKGRPVGFADAWIAAAALRHKLPLVTHNRRDFEGIPGLTVISEQNTSVAGTT